MSAIRALPVDGGRVRTRPRRLQLDGAFVGLLVVGTGLADGAYFPTAWGWTALVFLWACAAVLTTRRRFGMSRAERLFAGALAALVGWIGLSAVWSLAPPASVQEAERGVLVVCAGVVSFACIARGAPRRLLAGVLTGITSVAVYGLATRLFPDRLGRFDPIAGYRLSAPLGYWNAHGALAAIGLVLAIGLATRASSRRAAAAAAAATVPLAAAAYFTFGRGTWLAVVAGLAATLIVERRRLRLATTLLVLGPVDAVAVWRSGSTPALNLRAASLGAAVHEGRRLAIALVALAAAAALTTVGIRLLGRRIRPTPTMRRAYAGFFAVLLLAAAGLAVAHAGSPVSVARRAYQSFEGPPVHPAATQSLSRRLRTLSSNGRLAAWRVSWSDHEAHPWLGSGAGSYEVWWMRRRTVPGKLRDAHSLYLETLAELGPVGLALLLVALGGPLVAAVRARRHPLVPAAAGAYVAYLVHAAADWDWEMPAVTLTALFVGAAILVAARRESDVRVVSARARAGLLVGTLAVAAFAFVGLVGNLAIAASNDAARSLHWSDSARQARKAMRWAPWSSDPWRLLGDAQYAEGDFAAARASYRKAIAKDPNEWLLWAELSIASNGRERLAAAREALRLNPLSPEFSNSAPALAVKERR